MEGVPTKADSIFLLLSDLFVPPGLCIRFMGFMVDENRIQIWNEQFYSLSEWFRI